MEVKEKESRWFTDNCHIWKTEETEIITCITIADVCKRRNEYLQDRTKEKLLQIYLDDRQKYFCRHNHISQRAWKKHGIITRDDSKLGYVSFYFFYFHLWKKRVSEPERISTFCLNRPE